MRSNRQGSRSAGDAENGRSYLVLLRAIDHVPMGPFRQALGELGFHDVESFGMSGNLLFTAASTDKAELEQLIEARLGAAAFIRTRPELARVVRRDPFGSSILFLSRPPSTARRQAFLRLAFEEPRPVLYGRTAYFIHPARLQGRRSPIDFEGALGVGGTARSSAVVRRLLELMTEGE